MVALLVIFTIVGCLIVDSIVVSVRERRAVTVGEREMVGAHAMVFAQDGGEPIQESDEKVDNPTDGENVPEVEKEKP